MPKCDLTIRIDDPRPVYRGGERIRGFIDVDASSDVRCKSLNVSARWFTSGRGNTDRDSGSVTNLYTGEIAANERKSFPFELDAPMWPPTYDGHHIHVHHELYATMDIPWAFDPKATHALTMLPQASPIADPDPDSATSKTCGVLFIGFVAIIALVGSAIAQTPLPIIIAAAVGSVIGLLVYVFGVMPSRRLGGVDLDLAGRTSAGLPITGSIAFKPPAKRKFGPIEVTVVGKERAVRGSGTKKTTHHHTVFQCEHVVHQGGTAAANVPMRIPFEIPIDEAAPPTLKLKNNQINYQLKLRIDLPGFPDYRVSREVVVDPLHIDYSARTDVPPTHGPPDLDAILTPADDPPASTGVTFAELITHLQTNRHNDDARRQLVDAVTGMTLDFAAEIERRLLYTGDDPHVDDDHYAVWARAAEPDGSRQGLILYVPHALGDDLERPRRDAFRGRGVVLGYDTRHDRLKIKLV